MAELDTVTDDSDLLTVDPHITWSGSIQSDYEQAQALRESFEAALQSANVDGAEDVTFTMWLVSAFNEAVINAIKHGNWEDTPMASVTDTLKEREVAIDVGMAEIEPRTTVKNFPKTEAPVNLITKTRCNLLVRVRIKDVGKGYDYEAIPDPRLPENVDVPNGRGTLMAHRGSEVVHYPEEHKGRVIELIALCRGALPAELNLTPSELTST